ncbi:MAG: hypothetical protein AB1938_00690 [Myxococcota bacterium]
MSRLVFAVGLSCGLLAFPALAKPWNGIHPGVSSMIDVIGKFGEPSKKVMAKGQEVLVYSGPTAITGTVQAQFKCNPTTHVVERIDVYPAPVIPKEAVEKSYGRACDPMEAKEPCYYRKESASAHVYFHYVKLGLAVFFKDDGKTVQSFTFLPSTLQQPAE